MKNSKQKPINRKYLKRKKGETIQLDVSINKVNQIKIENSEGISKLTVINENSVILLFPSYIRKKRVNNL